MAANHPRLTGVTQTPTNRHHSSRRDLDASPGPSHARLPPRMRPSAVTP